MTLTPAVLGMLAFTLFAFWGLASIALVVTLRQEGRKVELLDHQKRIDTYSPKALAELRDWIESNPNDPLAERARQQHNTCVETLKETDRQFYDWSDEEIAGLDRV